MSNVLLGNYQSPPPANQIEFLRRKTIQGLLLALLFFIYFIPLNAQHIDEQELFEHLSQNVPDIGTKLQKEETQFQQFIQTESTRYSSSPAPQTPTSSFSKLIIPVIVGVIHAGAANPTFGTATPARIRGNLEVANSIFAANPIPYKGELKIIQFCLVNKKADGSPFPQGEEGILYLEDPNLANFPVPPSGSVFNPYIASQQAIFSGYSREKYCKILITNLPGDANPNPDYHFKGFAYTPAHNRFYSDPNQVEFTDGIALDYTAIWHNDPAQYTFFNRGAIMAHELGHWLNLWDAFQGKCGAATAQQNNQYYPIGDWASPLWDFITDTPAKEKSWDGTLNLGTNGCQTHTMTIPNTNPPQLYEPDIACSGLTIQDYQDMVYNTMDYASDYCRLIVKDKAFTPKQRERMSYALQFYRGQIFSRQNLVETGVACLEPVAAFSTVSPFVCGNESFGNPDVTITPLEILGLTNGSVTWQASGGFNNQNVEKLAGDLFEPTIFRFNTEKEREVTLTMTVSGTWGNPPTSFSASTSQTFFVHPSCGRGEVSKTNLVFGQKAYLDTQNPPMALPKANLSIFNSTEPNQIESKGGSVTYTTKSGGLGYYASGSSVWNQNHEVVKTGLSSAASGSQFGVYTDHPTEQYTHYLFTAPKNGSTEYTTMGLRAHKIRYFDLANSAIGIAVPAPPGAPVAGPTTDPSAKVSEKIMIIPGCQENESWLVVQGPEEDPVWGLRFYVYKIQSSGAISYSNYYEAGAKSKTGFLKSNASGEMFVCTYSNMDEGRGYGDQGSEARLFTFSRSTGAIAQYNRLILSDFTITGTYGASFNANGQYVYVNVNQPDAVSGNTRTQRAGIYKWDLKNLTGGGTLEGSRVGLVPYGVSPSLDLMLDGNDRILISNTLDPKVAKELAGRFIPTDNETYPLSGNQLGVLYCPGNSSPGLSWQGPSLIEDPSQKTVYSIGGLPNFVEPKPIVNQETEGLTQSNPKDLYVGGPCCPTVDVVNVACTGDDDGPFGNDIYYTFKVTRANPTVSFKELRVSTGDCDFEGKFLLEYLNSANSWTPVSDELEEAFGNGKFWKIEGASFQTNGLASPNPNEAVFRLKMNATSLAASGNFVLKMAYGNFPSPFYFEYNEVSCCRIGVNRVSEEAGIQSKDDPSFSVYPNPGRGRFHVEGVKENQFFQVRDIRGRLVLEGQVKEGQILADRLTPGVYQLHIPERPDLKNVKLVIQP